MSPSLTSFPPLPILACAALTSTFLCAATAPQPAIEWQHLSSRAGDLAAHPGGSTQQTGAVVADFDQDGTNDFILSFRHKGPALLFYRRIATGWIQYVIESEPLTLEAGGAIADIDGDGDLDVVFGGDYQSAEVWWWENPAPHFEKNAPWKRHLIKKSGAKQHHDQCFADFLGTGRPQLAFWNQKVSTLFLAEIPDNPRTATEWPISTVLAGAKPNGVPYIEGVSAYDIDADGRIDILACDSWFKHVGGREFKQIKFATHGGLIFAGYFKPSKFPQIVVSPGDGSGPIRWYECTGDPLNPADWKPHELLERAINHGHSLQLGDIDRDGHLDIFVAEMAKWTHKAVIPDNPNATAWIFYGDGRGNFRKTEFAIGLGWHETRLGDLDGDGDLDILQKPYNWEVPRVDVWLNGGTRSGARGVGTNASFHGPVGLQLWSLRDILKTNVPLGLQTARAFGFIEVEIAGVPAGLPHAQLRARLLAVGLKPVSGNWSYDEVARNLDKVVAEAKALGVRYVGVGSISRPDRRALTEADMVDAANTFNRAGEALGRAGIRFFFHPHGDEFVPHGAGRTLFDLLAEKTDSQLVCFEIDIFWAVHAGQDPVKLMQRHPNRWHLMHIKDMRTGTKTGLFTGRTDRSNDVVVGSGIIDVSAALREGQRQGIKHYFIEDESTDPLGQIPKSLRYLESLSWGTNPPARSQ
ncbi:MAG: TIM barrel protein [Verrucomicrobia bacterium]|nr:TIM barrel protein [Verrucomicrobiota bacterium]